MSNFLGYLMNLRIKVRQLSNPYQVDKGVPKVNAVA